MRANMRVAIVLIAIICVAYAVTKKIQEYRAERKAWSKLSYANCMEYWGPGKLSEYLCTQQEALRLLKGLTS